MILFNHYAIHTPTKCGTNSLLTMLRRLGGQEFLPRHGFTPVIPEVVRLLIVREPLDRMRSMYHHCFKYPPLQRYTSSLDVWQDWLENDADPIWRMSMTEIFNEWKPDVVFRLEDGLDNVLKYMGISLERIAHVNKSNTDAAFQVTHPTLLKRIEDDTNNFYLSDEQSVFSRCIHKA